MRVLATAFVIITFMGCDDERAGPTGQLAVRFAPELEAGLTACISTRLVADGGAGKVILDAPSFCTGDDPVALVVDCVPDVSYQFESTLLSVTDAAGLAVELEAGHACVTAPCIGFTLCAEDILTDLDAIETGVRLDNNDGYLDIAVNAELPSVPTNVCYQIEVSDRDGVIEWSEEACASEYGIANGSITYVGTCHSLATAHTVTITATETWPGAPPAGWANPCAAGCSQVVTCVEDADLLVTFNVGAP